MPALVAASSVVGLRSEATLFKTGDRPGAESESEAETLANLSGKGSNLEIKADRKTEDTTAKGWGQFSTAGTVVKPRLCLAFWPPYRKMKVEVSPKSEKPQSLKHACSEQDPKDRMV